MTEITYRERNTTNLATAAAAIRTILNRKLTVSYRPNGEIRIADCSAKILAVISEDGVTDQVCHHYVVVDAKGTQLLTFGYDDMAKGVAVCLVGSVDVGAPNSKYPNWTLVARALHAQRQAPEMTAS